MKSFVTHALLHFPLLAFKNRRNAFHLKNCFSVSGTFQNLNKSFSVSLQFKFFFLVLVCQILSLFHWSETFLEFQCTMITFFFSRREIGILCVCCWLVRSDWVKCLNSFPQKKNTVKQRRCVCRLPAHDSRDFRVVSTNFFSASFVGVLHEIARASEYVLGKP